MPAAVLVIQTAPPTASEDTFIATENTYLNGVFLKSKLFPFMHKKISTLKLGVH